MHRGRGSKNRQSADAPIGARLKPIASTAPSCSSSRPKCLLDGLFGQGRIIKAWKTVAPTTCGKGATATHVESGRPPEKRSKHHSAAVDSRTMCISRMINNAWSVRPAVLASAGWSQTAHGTNFRLLYPLSVSAVFTSRYQNGGIRIYREKKINRPNVGSSLVDETRSAAASSETQRHCHVGTVALTEWVGRCRRVAAKRWC
jgi:hypothetical protein